MNAGAEAVARRMQDESAIVRQRAAGEHRLVQADGRIARRRHDLQLAQYRGYRELLHRFIDHQTHGAFFVVLADVNHRALEARILQGGHGDQKMVL